MATAYGVLHGKVDIFKHGDNLDTPRLQVKVVDGQSKAWSVPVNLQAGTYLQEKTRGEGCYVRFNT